MNTIEWEDAEDGTRRFFSEHMRLVGCQTEAVCGWQIEPQGYGWSNREWRCTLLRDEAGAYFVDMADHLRNVELLELPAGLTEEQAKATAIAMWRMG